MPQIILASWEKILLKLGSHHLKVILIDLKVNHCIKSKPQGYSTKLYLRTHLKLNFSYSIAHLWPPTSQLSTFSKKRPSVVT